MQTVDSTSIRHDATRIPAVAGRDAYKETATMPRSVAFMSDRSARREFPRGSNLAAVESAEREARAILAVTEPEPDLVTVFPVRFSRVRGWQWDAKGTRMLHEPLSALAEALRAFDALEIS
jgi:hypothetical protein